MASRARQRVREREVDLEPQRLQPTGIVEEPGDNLPGLLGMDVLKSRRAIMDIGNKRLIFPGAGEVEIILPPGSVTTPLEEAPSGHLCMIIDDFSEIEIKQGGITTAVPPLKLPRNYHNAIAGPKPKVRNDLDRSQ